MSKTCIGAVIHICIVYSVARLGARAQALVNHCDVHHELGMPTKQVEMALAAKNICHTWLYQYI